MRLVFHVLQGYAFFTKHFRINKALFRRPSNAGASNSLILAREEEETSSFLSSSRHFECKIFFAYELFGIFCNLLNLLESFGIFWNLLETFGIFEQLGWPRTLEFLRVTQQFLEYLGRLRSREYLEPCLK